MKIKASKTSLNLTCAWLKKMDRRLFYGYSK